MYWNVNYKYGMSSCNEQINFPFSYKPSEMEAIAALRKLHPLQNGEYTILKIG